MRPGFRHLSRPALWGLLMISGMMLATATPARAQVCTEGTGAWVAGVVDPNTDADAIAVNANTDFDIEDVDFSIELGDAEIIAAIAGLDLDLQLLIGTLGGTNTNNATLNSGIQAKGMDYLAATSNTQQMQVMQAQEQGHSGAGNLGYMQNNLCERATISAGHTSITNAVASELCSYNPIYCQAAPPVVDNSNGPSEPVGCTTCGGDNNGTPSPPAVITEQFTAQSAVNQMHNIALAAQGFFGAVDCKDANGNQHTDGEAYTDSTGASATDSVPATHLDVDAMTLTRVLTYGDTLTKAHDQFTNYINGLTPEIPSHSDSFCANKPVSDAAMVAQREKLAFTNLSMEAMQMERAEHNPVNTGATAAVAAIFKNANFSPPTASNPNGSTQVSEDALEDALYREAADNPQYFANLSSMNEQALLAFLGGEMLLMNRMEWRRFQVEKEMFKVQSASLNLQERGFNFGQNQ